MKRIGLVIISLLIIISLVGCGSSGNYVAKVDNKVITQQMLDDKIKKVKDILTKQGSKMDDPKMQSYIKEREKIELQSMIDEIVIEKELDRLKIKPTDKEIQQKIDMAKKAYTTKEQFNTALKNLSMTEKDYENWIRKQIYYQKLFAYATKDVKVNETDVKKYFEQNKALFRNASTTNKTKGAKVEEPTYEKNKENAHKMYEGKVKNEAMLNYIKDARKRYKIVNKLETATKTTDSKKK